jgi:Ca-activated chloride channel family protein
MSATPILTSDDTSCGGRLVTADGRTLPLERAHLGAEARAGLCRVVVEQRWRNTYQEPLAVTYTLPLPADGAVSGFSFRVGDRRVVGEIDRRAAARERFEQAVLEGRTAALLEQDRSSLFQQEIGNIPPGAEVWAEVIVDQPLAWTGEGAWEWRFPTVAMPRYLGAPGRVADAERVTQDVADAPLGERLSLAIVIRDPLVEGGRPESPSHAVMARADAAGGGLRVELAADRLARLDRDVVVRWPVAQATPGATLAAGRGPAGREHARDRSHGLVTIVPPRSTRATVARDVCVLLDTSGSMGGEPLDQARRIVSAIVSSLGETDQLEMIEFSSHPRRWKRKSVAATAVFS